MVRVLFLINSFGGGGAEKVLVNLVNNMDSKKFDISVRALVDDGPNKMYLSDKVTYDFICLLH